MSKTSVVIGAEAVSSTGAEAVSSTDFAALVAPQELLAPHRSRLVSQPMLRGF